MHEVIKRKLENHFDFIQFDNMDWGGQAHNYNEKHLDELVVQCNNLVPTFEKDEIIALKCGEMFSANEINYILDKVSPNFPNKRFIILCNDNREFDFEYDYINALSGWAIVRETFLNTKGDFNQIQNNNRNKLFLSRNNRGKQHRLDWIEFLEKNNLKNKGYVSEGWNGIFLEHLNNDFIETVEHFDDESYEHGGRYPSRDDKSLMNFYNDSFCEVVLSSEYKRLDIFGAFCTEKEWRPFLMCVIPMIIMFKNYDKYLKQAGYDLFEDVIDTSFYHTDNLQKKFDIVKKNFKIIENDLTLDSRFREDIWKRLKENQFIFLDGWDKYFWKKYNEL